MNPTDGPNPKAVPWRTKSYTGTAGKAARVFATTWTPGTISKTGFRRLMVNACYWAMGLEDDFRRASGYRRRPQSQQDRVWRTQERPCSGEYETLTRVSRIK
jgi:hypothetical protein